MFKSIIGSSPSGVKQKYDASPRLTPGQGLLIFSGIGLVGASVGAAIGTYVFFGSVTLAGLIALIESNSHLKRLASRSTTLIDVTIFAGTLYATASLGVTVSAALVFAGLGYTLVYSPYLKNYYRDSYQGSWYYKWREAGDQKRRAE